MAADRFKKSIRGMAVILTAFTALFTANAIADMGEMGGRGGNGGGSGGGRGVRGGDEGQSRQTQQQRPMINTDNLREILTFAQELGLSEKQVEDIRQIRSDSIKEITQSYEAVKKTQAELSDMLGLIKTDFDAAREKLKKMNEEVINTQMISINAYEKAFNLLSDGQKVKLVTIREKISKERMDENTHQDPTQGH